MPPSEITPRDIADDWVVSIHCPYTGLTFGQVKAANPTYAESLRWTLGSAQFDRLFEPN